ncbi:MAG: TetR/AcrR family transcriptional regulator [Oscillospiraceae bacterium]|nr:TetR/AcrR family transcriptional regulator [Oscillospiraceae bacterium]
MNEEQKDRRIRKTKLSIRKALIELLMKKPLNTITVIEICELADINRGTFYLHYRDIFDLFGKIQDEMYTEIIESICKRTTKDNYGATDTLLATLADIFDFLSKNYEACIVLLGSERSQDFIDRMLLIGHDECIRNWTEAYRIIDTEFLESFYHYMVSGCIGIFKHWLDSGRRESSGELAARTEKCVRFSLGVLEKYDEKSRKCDVIKAK